MPIAPDVPHDPVRDFDASWVEALGHTWLVHRVARQWLGQGLELDDLIQEGLFGVKRAVEIFDSRRAPCDRRKSFARYAARAAGVRMRDAIRASGRTIVLPHWVREAVARSLGGRPQPGDSRPRTARCIADALAVLQCETFGTHTVPGHALLAETPDRDDGPDAPTVAELGDRLDALPARERRIIRDYYGFDGPPLSQAEIGAALGLTGKRIFAIRQRGLARLRKQLEATP